MAVTALQTRHPVRAIVTAWLGWTALTASANLASPLYAVYADRFGRKP